MKNLRIIFPLAFMLPMLLFCSYQKQQKPDSDLSFYAKITSVEEEKVSWSKSGAYSMVHLHTCLVNLTNDTLICYMRRAGTTIYDPEYVLGRLGQARSMLEDVRREIILPFDSITHDPILGSEGNLSEFQNRSFKIGIKAITFRKPVQQYNQKITPKKEYPVNIQTLDTSSNILWSDTLMIR